MFTQTFVDGLEPSRKAFTVTISTAIQVVAVCMAILLPLLYRQSLPSAQLKSILSAPMPPARKPVTTIKSTARQGATVTKSFQPIRISEIKPLPKTPAMSDAAPNIADLGNDAGFGSGASDSTLLFSSVGPAAEPRTSPPPISKPKAPGLVRVGGRVAAANLLRRVEPQYPHLALVTRVQGDVEFSAIISKTGQVEHLQLVRGHPLLVNAAREAILQWRYRPTLLNGEPVEVATDIVVAFKLAQ